MLIVTNLPFVYNIDPGRKGKNYWHSLALSRTPLIFCRNFYNIIVTIIVISGFLGIISLERSEVG